MASGTAKPQQVQGAGPRTWSRCGLGLKPRSEASLALTSGLCAASLSDESVVLA